MSPPRSNVDPDHDAKRAFLSRVGLVLVAVGAPLGVIGFVLFVSVFFTGFDGFGPPVRPIIGMILMIVGGFMTSIGFQMLTFGNAGRILRYGLAESLPPATDAAREFAPTAQDLARHGGGDARGLLRRCSPGQDPARLRRLERCRRPLLQDLRRRARGPDLLEVRGRARSRCPLLPPLRRGTADDGVTPSVHVVLAGAVWTRSKLSLPIEDV